MMPEMDGFQFLGELRKIKRFADTPVIVLTAMDLTDSDRSILNAQVTMVLEKAATGREELLRQLRTHVPISTSKPAAGDEGTTGEWMSCPESRRGKCLSAWCAPRNSGAPRRALKCRVDHGPRLKVLSR